MIDIDNDLTYRNLISTNIFESLLFPHSKTERHLKIYEKSNWIYYCIVFHPSIIAANPKPKQIKWFKFKRKLSNPNQYYSEYNNSLALLYESEIINLEIILEDAPPEIQIKILYHLDILDG